MKNTRAIHLHEVFALRPIACGVMLACCGGAWGNPVGPNVAAGAATFSTKANTLTVTNTPGTIINWQSFSIGTSEHTRFNQQSASSAVLNRVVGQDGSSILGMLSSNGRVFLVNPHGVVFGPGARIDTAGFIASTLNITDKDFLQGKLKFEGGGHGALRNERGAEIRASGDIVLVGPVVENMGLIRSDHGAVLLAAGKSVTITSPDAQGVKFELQAPSDTALNLGTIEASGAASMLAGTLRHSGDIRATAASVEGARVVLTAQKDATVDAGATITASGAHGGSVTVQSGDTTIVSGRIDATGSAGAGGTVQLLGSRVGVFNGASVDASGTTGGGTILVGGDYQGRNPDIPNASQTIVASGTTLRADALENGDGGKVIVWADNSTRFGGHISARGGEQSGDGGFVEVSGKKFLAFRGTVDTRAPHGKTGTLLLDPTTYKIVAADSGTSDADFKDQRFEESGTEPAVSEITTTQLRNALTTSDVFITTQSSGPGTGDIDFEAAFDYNGIGTKNLWLFADRDVNFKQAIFDGAGTDDSLSLIIKSGGATNVSAGLSLGMAGIFDASRDGSRVVNMTSGTPAIFTAQFKAGTLNVSNVAATLSSSMAPVIGDVNLTSGALDVPGGVLPRLDMSGGTLTATGGNLEITGPFNATGGTILASGNGEFITRGPTKIGIIGAGAVPGTPSTLSTERNWNNMGVLDLDAGSINLLSGVTFTNVFVPGAPSGVVNINSASASPFGTEATAAVVNESVFNKVSTGTSTINAAFQNVEGGTLNVRAGNLAFAQPVSQGGTIEVFGGATLSTLGNDLTNNPNTVIGGAGTIDLGGGTLINNGRLRPGPLNEPVSGTLTIAGNLTSADPMESVIEIQLRGSPASGNFDVVDVSGTATLGGRVILTTPPGLTPADDYVATNGHVFQVLRAGSLASSAFSMVDKRFGNGLVDGTPTYNYAGSPQTVTLQILGAPIKTWINPMGGDWSVGTNWSGATVPGINDTVVINVDVAGDTITIPTSYSAMADRIQSSNARIVVDGSGSLELRNRSTITGSGTEALHLEGSGFARASLLGTGRVVLGALRLRSGEIENTGGVVVTGLTLLGDTVGVGLESNRVSGRLTVDRFDMPNPGELVITPTGTLVFTGNAAKNIGGGMPNKITNLGTIRFEGGNPNLLGVEIDNLGRFELVDGADLFGPMPGNTFSNTGSGRVIVSRTTAPTPSAPGPVDSTFQLGAFENIMGGEVEARADTTVTYASASNMFGDSRMTGAGVHRVVAGSSIFTGTINSSNLVLEGGTFDGLANLAGNTAWTGGTMLGTFTIPEDARLDIGGSPTNERVLDGVMGGMLANLGTVNITSGGNVLRNGAVIENGNSAQFGRINFVGAGALVLEDTSEVNNRYHGLVELTPTSLAAKPIAIAPGGTGSMLNEGVVQKALGSAQTQSFDVPFENAGIVTIDAGTLALPRAGGNPDTGYYGIADNAVLDLSGGNRIFETTLSTSDEGTIRLVGGTLDARNGILPGVILGGDATLNQTMPGDLTILGRFDVGNAAVGMGAEPDDQLITEGQTTVNGVLTLARSWTNNGVLDIETGRVSPVSGLSAFVRNEGTVNITTPDATPFSETAAELINSGTINFMRTVSGPGEFDHPFTNLADGTLNVRSGTLRFTGEPVTHNGAIVIGAGATLATIGSFTNPVGARIGGDGTLDLSFGGSTGTLTSSGNLTPGAGTGLFFPGAPLFPGTLDIVGNLVLNSGTIDGLGSVAVTGTTTVNGISNVTSGLNPNAFVLNGALNVGPNATLSLLGGDTTTFSPASSLNNAGTTNFAGSDTINAAFSNTGRVNVDGGTLTLGGNGTDTGVYALDGGTALDLTAERTFAPGITFTGTGRVRSFSTLNVTGPLTFAQNGVAFDMNGGTLIDTAGVTFNGELNWSGGTITGSGVMTTGANANTSITGPVTLLGKIWDNSGDIALTSGGQLVLAGPASAPLTMLINRGTGVITDTSTNATPITTTGSRTNKSFANAGAFNKDAGSADTQTLDVPMTNTGFGVAAKGPRGINVRTGTLVANSFPTNNGDIDLETGTTFSTAGAPFTNGVPGSMTGNGTILSPTLTNLGSLGPGDSPGMLTVAGNFVQGDSGTLVVELGGTLAGTDYDVLRVTGNATLGGTLAIFTTRGQSIAAGSAFDFLTYASRTEGSDFADFIIPAGTILRLSPGPTGYRITSGPAPEVVAEINRIGQKDILVFAERRPDNVLVGEQPLQKDDEKDKALGDCR